MLFLARFRVDLSVVENYMRLRIQYVYSDANAALKALASHPGHCSASKTCKKALPIEPVNTDT